MVSRIRGKSYIIFMATAIRSAQYNQWVREMATNLGKLAHLSVTHMFNFIFSPLHTNNKIFICPMSTVMFLSTHQSYIAISLKHIFVTALTIVQASRMHCLPQILVHAALDLADELLEVVA